MNNGASGFAVSSGVITDLLCEGEIEGVVNYEYTDLKGTRGSVGFDSVVTTNIDYLRSIYFNEEPIKDKQGLFNFQQVDIRTTKGTPNGDTSSPSSVLKPDISYTRSINERLRGRTNGNSSEDTFAKYYSIINKNVSKIKVNLKVLSLSSVTGTGDVGSTSVSINTYCRPIYIDATSQGFSEAGNPYTLITGISSSPYIRSITLDLASLITRLDLKSNKNFVGWEVKVYRTTLEPTDTKIRNQTYVDSITEIYETQLSYPNTSVVYAGFNAEYFSEIPDRYYDVRMLKVSVPNNYDVVRRKYNGDWNGAFAMTKQWTDNPAWCFYDLISNPRYGLGKYLTSDLIDKWSLYKIAQYCDQLVDDGYGGLEPRFTCNLLIQSREEAFKVINDMASVFRAINYYCAGNIYTVQDAPKSPIYQFANANVNNGEFSYSNSSRKVRHTVAVIRYNDKNNFYKPAVEYVEDIDGIRKYGYREIEATAFGCTSRGQAIRFGRWTLLTETLETESVNFKTGPEGGLLRPGDVIDIIDSNRKISQRSGRTFLIENNVAGQTLNVTLDRELKGLDSNVFYNLSLSTPTFNYDSISGAVISSSQTQDIRKNQILNFSFSPANITSIPIRTGEEGPVYASRINFSNKYIDTNVYNIIQDTVWGVFTTGISSNPNVSFEEGVLQEEKYRVININEDADNNFSISAIEYNELKYSAIESGIAFDTLGAQNISQFPKPPAIQDFSISHSSLTQNTFKFNISIIPPKKANGETNDDNISYYVIYARQSDGSSSPFTSSIPSDPLTLAASVTKGANPVGILIPNKGGKWWFRVYSVNPLGERSDPSPQDKNYQIPEIYPIKDVQVKSLRLAEDILISNAPGSNDASLKIFTTNQPNFAWESVNPNNLGDIKYAIKIKKDDGTYSLIIDEWEDSDFTFDALSNLRLATRGGKTYINEYKRNFSLYVEAHDINKNSSKGDTVSSNIFTSPNNGYDFVIVQNPELDISKFSSFGASLGVDGLVSIYNLPKDTDAEGFYVLYSLNDFSYSSDLKNNPVSALINKKVFIKKFQGVNDVSFSLHSNSDLSVLGGFPSVAADTIYVAIAPFDAIDKLKDSIFAQYVGKESTIGLSPFEPSSWIEVTALNGTSSKQIKRNSTGVSNSVGQGFKAWIRIKDDGTWVGKGIKMVKRINSSTVYPNYKGYSPFNCSPTKRTSTFAEVGFYGGIDAEGFDIVDWKNINITDTDHYCGWASNPWNSSTYLNDSNSEAFRSTLLFDYKANKEYSDQFNSESSKDGFRRYRIYFNDDSLPKDAAYAVIGMNAYNGNYLPFPKIVEKYKLNQYVNADITGKFKDVESLGLAVAGGNTSIKPIYDNEIFSDSPWWKNHPAGFGQGWGGLNKTQQFFDVHMGHLVDFSYLQEGFFAVVSQDDVGNTFNAVSAGNVT
jgi:hypothetical protein